MKQKQQNQEYAVEQLNYGRRVLDFLRWGKIAIVISSVLVVASIIAVIVFGFNKGLDFTGGVSVEVTFSKPVNINQIRQELVQHGYVEPVVQNFGSTQDVMIRLAPTTKVDQDKLSDEIVVLLHKTIDAKAQIKQVQYVGPSVGGQLELHGFLAILACLLAVMVYIAFRFEWRLGAGAVLALGHDVIITVGYLAICHVELDLTTIAALLSVIGYSLNDTIVVFDRIRENFRKIRRGSSYDIMNISLTQTLRRTLMTSGTTLLVIACLYFFGGSMLHGFSETLGIGIVLGTFSSIYVASYLALLMGVKREHMLTVKVEKEGADQPSMLP